MFNSIDNDMPPLASIFGSSKSESSTPKPAGKRLASPLKGSPVPSDDDDESSDYVMGEINDEKKSKSDPPEEEDIQMEQAGYGRDAEGNAHAASSANTEAGAKDQGATIRDLG